MLSVKYLEYKYLLLTIHVVSNKLLYFKYSRVNMIIIMPSANKET